MTQLTVLTAKRFVHTETEACPSAPPTSANHQCQTFSAPDRRTTADATHLPERSRSGFLPVPAVQRSNVRKTRFPSRVCDKQVISDGIISIVVKRGCQPRLATIVCHPTGRGAQNLPIRYRPRSGHSRPHPHFPNSAVSSLFVRDAALFSRNGARQGLIAAVARSSSETSAPAVIKATSRHRRRLRHR